MPLREQQITRTIKNMPQIRGGNRDTIWRRRKKKDWEKEKTRGKRRSTKQEQKWPREMEAEHERRTKNDANPRTIETEKQPTQKGRKKQNPTQTMPAASGQKDAYSRNKTTGSSRRRGKEKKKHNNSAQGRAAMKKRRLHNTRRRWICRRRPTIYGKDDNGKMRERLGNNDISTETVALKIQWIKVLLLVHAGGAPKAEIPPPFDQIRFSQGGTILGNEIYIWQEN